VLLLVFLGSNVGGSAWWRGCLGRALSWQGGSEEVVVRPQHVSGEHGSELGRQAKIWAARPIWQDGSNHGRGRGIYWRLGSPVPAALCLDCLLPLMSLRHGGDSQRGGLLVSRIMAAVLGFLLSPR
jgi:hypothetical protein